jgi:hypothetical protein
VLCFIELGCSNFLWLTWHFYAFPWLFEELFDVAIRPSAEVDVAETLLTAVKGHARRVGRSGSLLVRARSSNSMKMFEQLGFTEKNIKPSDDVDAIEMELKH